MASKLALVFCKKNLELHSQPVLDALQRDYPDVEIEVKDCLDIDVRGICADVPFVMRYNSLIIGRDARDLYKKIVKGMNYIHKPALPGTASYLAQGQDEKNVGP